MQEGLVWWFSVLGSYGRHPQLPPPWPLFWWEMGAWYVKGSSFSGAPKPGSGPDSLILEELAGKVGPELNQHLPRHYRGWTVCRPCPTHPWYRRALWRNCLDTGTHLLNHNSIDAHLLEAAGVVEHVGPAHGQGEHHGGHVLLVVGEVQHHGPQHEQ